MVVGLRAASRASADANQLHLAGRLALVEARVRRLLEQNGRFATVDPLGSIAITPTQIERLLADAPDCPDEGPTESELAAEAERMDEEATAFERQGADVRLTDLARRSGGSIRNIALTAAFFAAEGDGCLHMEDLIWGVQREYRKLGRLSSAAEFGPWWELVSG